MSAAPAAIAPSAPVGSVVKGTITRNSRVETKMTWAATPLMVTRVEGEKPLVADATWIESTASGLVVEPITVPLDEIVLPPKKQSRTAAK